METTQPPPDLIIDRKPVKGLLFLVLGLLLLGWLLQTPPGILGKADAVGYAVCHQIDVRSFHLGDRAFSFCARCSGMFLGALLGLVYQFALGRRRSGAAPWPVLLVLGAFVLAFAVDGTNSYLRFFIAEPLLYEPRNWLRLLTGTGMGLTIAAGLYPAFQSTVWQRTDPRPALGSLRRLAGLVILGLGLVAVILTENPLILYPLSLLSAASVLLILTLVYSMVLLMLLRAENRFERPRQVLMPLVGGFLVALLQIAALDLARYLLTNTWGEFPIPGLNG